MSAGPVEASGLIRGRLGGPESETNSIFVDWTAARSPGLCPFEYSRYMETDKSISRQCGQSR
jgi:hypothetical protein